MLVLASGCGPSADHSGSPTASSPVAANAPTAAEAPEASDIRTEPPSGCEPGYAEPFTPSLEDLRAVSAGLALHHRDDFVGAIQAFSSLVERVPNYGSARFNLACAQARAGQLDAARSNLERVLCDDLPTNLPRALADEDLAVLRGHIEALGAELVRRYRDAGDGGASLVAFGKTEDPRDDGGAALFWSQPGFWKAERFVPAGPRLQRRAVEHELPMYPSFVADDRVVQVETVCSQAEGDYLPSFRVIERSLFDGVERSSRRFDETQSEFFAVRLGVHEGRTWVQFDSMDAPPTLRTVALASGAVMQSVPPESAAIQFGMSRWEPSDSPTSIEISRRANSVSFGPRSIDLSAPHGGMPQNRIIAQGDVAVIHSFLVGDCGSPDRFVIEAVDTRTGALLWHEQGEGQRFVHFQDGRLWVQSNNSLFVFPDARSTVRTELPRGLGLSSTFINFNPMC